ncbi:MAG: acetoacetate--CoA ligase [Pseudomonadota bacterium]|nr:MAG: acetoacetate--CoA ligase [Pseudomonadota bacterium]
MGNEGELLWKPGRERIEASRIFAFARWLEERRGLKFDVTTHAGYDALWRWSVTDLEGFWSAIWEFFGMQSSAPWERVLGRREMPGAEWFPGARLNYAEHILRHERPGVEALFFLSERRPLSVLSWEELGSRVRVLATRLRELGVKRGDRVVACLPNAPEAAIAMLATTSLGAIWSSCGPDFGIRGVLDRFSQLEPRILFCVDGYQYGGKPFSRKAELREIIAKLPSLERVVQVPYLDPQDRERLSDRTLFWDELFDHPPVPASEFRFEQLPFDHPLWILFSSGTTGLPKPIVHSHGGIIIEQLKHLAFNFDVHARERMFFFTTTGWMMWNFVVSGLLSDAVPVLYDGNPTYPDPGVLWQMVEQSGASLFGASPTYISMLQQAGIVPKDRFDLSKLKSVTLAGSPVTPEHVRWVYDNVKRDLWVAAGSGGTDICSGIVGGVVTLPVYAGEIQARSLGVAAHAFNEHGEPVIDEVGELVITQPMPSMPVCFWNDPDGKRYRESYFEEFPGVWRHGDFFKLNSRGGAYVLGRSDATLNRYGVRIGTAEIYRTLATLEEIEDSLIVNLDLPGGRFFMPLFVKLKEGFTLDEALDQKIRQTLRKEYSPRHAPDKIYAVPGIPYTLTGKKMEVPVRRILMGFPPEKVANRDATANPQALDWFIEYFRTQKDYSLTE